MTAAIPVLDAHVHVWDLAARPQPWIDPDAMAVIHRDHPVAELEATLAAAGVTESLLVQVINDPDETEEFMWAASSPVVAGVVGWVDLLAPSVGDEIDKLVDHPSDNQLVGLRHVALTEPDPGAWLSRFGASAGPAAIAERGLVCDLVVRPEHLAVAQVVVAAHDDLVFVLDHAGKAPVLSGWGSAATGEWAERIARLAPLDNLVVKLSGLTTMADLTAWQTADLAPYVDHLLACFGPERLVFGSDWPVSRRAGDYGRTIDTARALVAALSPAEQALVLSGTARRVYRL